MNLSPTAWNTWADAWSRMRSSQNAKRAPGSASCAQVKTWSMIPVPSWSSQNRCSGVS